MARTRNRLLVAFAAIGGVMLVGSIAWACTALVGTTTVTNTDTPEQLQVGAPSGGAGDTVEAVGTVMRSQEPTDCDNSDSGGSEDCTYELRIADPDSGAAHMPGSCHYDDSQSGLIDDDPTLATEAGVTTLQGSGPLPTTVSDGSKTMGSGETVVCFNSDEEFPSGAPAAGTAGTPFLLF